MRKIYKSQRTTENDALPIKNGGFGATTGEKAAAAIGMVSGYQDMKPKGIIVLDNKGIVPKKALPGEVSDPSVPSLEGTLRVGANQSTVLTITNFDSYMLYTVSATLGTAVRRADQITFYAGSTAGKGTLTINDLTFDIVIDVPVPVQPSITGPAEGSELRPYQVTVTASPFSIYNDSDTFASSDWELSTSSTFDVIEKASYKDTTNLTSWTVKDMKEYTKYYVRTRQRGAQNGVSDWSKTSSFTTKGTTLLSYDSKFTANDVVAGDSFGFRVGISADGNYAISGSAYDSDYGSCAGTAYIFKKIDNVWVQQTKLHASDPDINNVFGSSVCLNSDGTYAVVGSDNANNLGIRSGAVYVFTRTADTWELQQKITATDGAASDLFGFACAINGDASLLLVGSHGDDDTATDSGSVYVFTRSGSTWTHQQKLHAGDASASANFGTGVAISSDGNYAAIGASSTLSNLPGAVYIFTRSGSNWTFQQKINAPDKKINDCFGFATALNTTGSRLIIGTPIDTTKGIGSGAVYVFTRTVDNWSYRQKFYAPDASVDDMFGCGVGVSGDGLTVLIGAHGDDDAGTTTGSVYVFTTKFVLSFEEYGKIYPETPSSNEYFGTSCALSEDGSYALIGASNAAVNGINCGTVYVFKRNENSWLQVQKLVPDTITPDIAFGFSVAVNSDGTLAMVGSYRNSDVAEHCGAVYVFTCTGDVWTQQQKIYAPDWISEHCFGVSVSLTSDGSVLLVGAHADSEKGSFTGAVYFFVRSGDVWTSYQKIFASDPIQNGYFGVGVAINNDATIALIGAFRSDGNSNDAGGVYVFIRSGNTWTQQQKIYPNVPADNSQFGYKISLGPNGDCAAISCYLDDDKGTNIGAVYIFTRSGTTWTQVQKLYPSDSATLNTNAGFGISVSFSSDMTYLLIGAYCDSTKVMSGGSVYMFR